MASRVWFLSCSVIPDNMDGSRQMLEFTGCRGKGDGEEGSIKDNFLKIAHDASSTCKAHTTMLLTCNRYGNVSLPQEAVPSHR